MMGEVVAFRRKKLSGFLPDETAEEYRASIKAMVPLEKFPGVPGFSDTAPSEVNPDSGDCA